MPLAEGIYEQLINKLISNKLGLIDNTKFFTKSSVLDKEEAARYLSVYLAETIKFALSEIKDDNKTLRQIELSNKIIQLLIEELPKIDLSENLLDNEGKILEAVYSKLDSPFADFNERVKQITPYTRLSQSELFTGNNAGISLESEIKKEIQSSDEICWLVSFIRFSGIRIFEKELLEFTNSGKKLRIITTTYMGATEPKAIEFLSSLKNTEIKISYNSDHERLHAKAYLFLRNTGFNTGYIGSSNISRSALTNGLEWNVKITSKEISHIIDKFTKTFETYWLDKDFEKYELEQDKSKLLEALKLQKSFNKSTVTAYFDLTPNSDQKEILEKLRTEREVHNRFKNLIVAATGTGKTVVSAFDYRNFKNNNPRARLLFVAHKKEILEQSRLTFQHVLKDANFGQLWVDGQEPDNYEYVFASVYTLANRIEKLQLTESFYDFIIIDEVHHIAAQSYRPVLAKFKPQILLGLTATPERHDGGDILNDFCGVIASEIRLPEAINKKLLSPFQYFALSDSIDLTTIRWVKGKYDINELSKLYTENDRRTRDILNNCYKYLTDVDEVRAIGFCVSIEHAKYMFEKFTIAGLKAAYLTSENSEHRETLRKQLQDKEINFLFVRDIFNEGVDIPEIDTVLFLRPTESLTIFLQQLGRGLRLANKKECLTVLDFVGNSNANYDFAQKFRALIGKTQTAITKEIEDEFPHLPLGCSIILEEKARKVILENIRAATKFTRDSFVKKIQDFERESGLPLTLLNFIAYNHLEPQRIYKRSSWSVLCAEAGAREGFVEPNEKELTNCIKRLLSCNSISYFKFLKELLESNFNLDSLSQEQEIMLLMFHYDVWQKAGTQIGIKTIKQSIKQISTNPIMIREMLEILEYLINKTDFIETPIDLDFTFPLRVHGRYNIDHIVIAMGMQSFEKMAFSQTGVFLNEKINVESLVTTLKKSEKDYSPTTLYDDYAISESLFHWQSQNNSGPEKGKGLSYINQEKLDRKIFIFVREQREDIFGQTMAYVFLGEANYVNSRGSKPMNIEWQLKEPMPAYIWKESGKLAVG